MAEQQTPEEILGGLTPPEAPPELPAAEEPTESELAIPAGEGLDLTIEQEPNLSGRRVGDTMTFAIREISDDGNSYKLVFTDEGSGLEIPSAAGEDEVAKALTGL